MIFDLVIKVIKGIAIMIDSSNMINFMGGGEEGTYKYLIFNKSRDSRKNELANDYLCFIFVRDNCFLDAV